MVRWLCFGVWLGFAVPIVVPATSAIAWAAPEARLEPHIGFEVMNLAGNVDQPDEGREIDVTHFGVVGGVSVQLPLSVTWSLNTFLQLGGGGIHEENRGADDVNEQGYFRFGLQGRHWFDDWYAGLHVAHTTETIGNNRSDISGLGVGAALGFERKDRWFAFAQIDAARLNSGAGDLSLVGVQFNVGYSFDMPAVFIPFVPL